ncbi:MAG: hypothetical protein DRJ69_05130 [Thermoprotei archaeon]|nr:MAG: hypothetical protein DRJ69_05130 [Thermoprotei archaeon]
MKDLAIDSTSLSQWWASTATASTGLSQGCRGLQRLVEEVEPGTLIIEDSVPLNVKASLIEKAELYVVTGRDVAAERRRRGVKKNDAKTIYRFYAAGRASASIRLPKSCYN